MAYQTQGNVAVQDTGIPPHAPQYANQAPPPNNNSNYGLEQHQQQLQSQPQHPEAIYNTQPQQHASPGYTEKHGINPDQNIPLQDNYQQDKHAQTGQQQGGPKPQYQSVTALANLQQGAAPVDCPICGVRDLTRTQFVSGGTTHISAILLCCCLCLGCIPYMADWFKDCEHNCGNCGAMLAIWHRSGGTEVLAHARA